MFAHERSISFLVRGKKQNESEASSPIDWDTVLLRLYCGKNTLKVPPPRPLLDEKRDAQFETADD